MGGDEEQSLVGQTVDGYRIQEVLGRGGMGVVYKAENVSLSRIEALKVIAPSFVRDEKFLRRFRREARALAQIHHPNIVTIYTLRHAALGHYLTMEYVEGQTLADALPAGEGLSWHAALPVVKQLLAAFDYAHRRGIIHRDIKPRNIMLTPDGTVKVMDFGLAKFYQQHDATHTQGVAGTLCYMSPEQVKGHTNLDPRSDIFSLGLTLYEMLSGRLPFDKTESQFSIQRSIVEDDFPAPHRFCHALPAPLSAVIMKAVRKAPEHRYQEASEMLSAIEAFEAAAHGNAEPDQSHATAPPARADAAPQATGSWRRWVAGAAVIASVAVGAAVLTSGRGDSGRGADLGNAPLTADSSSAARARAPAASAPVLATDTALSARPDLPAAPLEEKPSEQAAPEERLELEAGAPGPPESGAAAGSEPAPGVAASGTTAPSTTAPGTTASGTTASGTTAAREAPADSEASRRTAEERPAARPEAATPAAERARRLQQLRAEATSLQRTLEQAILTQEWSAVPPPLARYYASMLDDVYDRFRILNVESTASDWQVDGADLALPVTVYISHQQKGREGVMAFPIPAAWVWEDSAEGFTLRRVQEL